MIPKEIEVNKLIEFLNMRISFNLFEFILAAIILTGVILNLLEC